MTQNSSKVFTLKNGRRVGYIEYGDPKGKPVFFFHGWPGSRFSGKETHAAANKVGVRIISTDRPGIGLSDFQKNRTLLDWPDDITELANYLKIQKFSLMGVSGGGPYVAACAYKLSKRVHKAGIVVGLAPVHIKENLIGMPFFSRMSWANYHAYPLLRKIASAIVAVEFKYIPFIGMHAAFPTKQDSLLYQNAVRTFAGEEQGTREAFHQGMKGTEEELRVYTDNWGFDLSKIRVKTYLWYGALDRCAPLAMGKYYESHIPNSKLFIDEDGGHLSRYSFEDTILRTLTQ